MTNLERCWWILEKRNLAGKNGNFNVRCHVAVVPLFWIEVIAAQALARTTQAEEHFNYREDHSKYPNYYNYWED
ncbi:hypothetical protein NEUTE2DRAFT_63948 [Neurospora tetrasperma FGSC 2509]|nr:hypothetical protein NEUTE2DRAFT_63948 [Neurospora tetrasperma FGSC 2509]